MSQDPRFRVDSPIAATRQEISNHSVTPSSPHIIQERIRDISRTLAAHGAGAASTELALDLVLHEIAVEVRELTRASGASIAWMREGQMVCRATTGDRAPQLGDRVGVESGLTGICINSQRVQICRDTNAERRFDADDYSRVGVRSMLFAPISNEGELWGILQLFSSSPDVFGEKEVLATQTFINRCIEATIEAGEWRNEGTEQQVRMETAGKEDPCAPPECISEIAPAYPHDNEHLSRSRLKSLSNSMLLVVVLTTAIVLGLLIGWRKGSKQSLASAGRATVAGPPVAVAIDSDAGKSLTGDSSTRGSTPNVTPPPSGSPDKFSDGMPTGGLIIVEDGKVVYRTSGLRENSATATPPPNSRTALLYRVDPEYPPEALGRNVAGAVVLDVTVRGNGSVGDVAVKSGDPLLRESAVAAVKQWRFAAFSSGADGVDRQTRVTIKFILPAR